MNKKYNAFLENCNGSDEDRAVKMFNDMKRKEIEMDNTIEKAMSKTEQVNKALNEVTGEVTASTVLEQCIRMSKNKDIDAFYSYSGHIDNHHIYVNYKTGYSAEDTPTTIYNSLYSDKSLTEIYQDLIKIEVEQGN